MKNFKFNHANSQGNCLKIISWLTLLNVVLITTASVAASAQTILMKDVESAVLKEDWLKIVELLKDVSDDVQKSPDPVLRLIKAHDCLALNRNNESVCLFLSVVVPEDLEKCDKWAKSFMERNSRSAIAYYFKGDVLARMKNWDAAIKTFNQANKLHPRHPLVLNARGVVYAAIGRCDDALCDFDEATNANVTFADAYANHGMLNIQRTAGAEGALEAFNRALDWSKDYGLALVGRGCTQLVCGHLLEARNDFELAKKKSGCMEHAVDDNIRRMLAHMGLVPDTDLEKLSKADLGTELSKLQTAYYQNPNQHNTDNYLNKLDGIRHTDPGLYRQAVNADNTFGEMNKGWAGKAAPNAYNWTEKYAPGGILAQKVALLPTGGNVSIHGYGGGVSGIGLPDLARQIILSKAETGQQIMKQTFGKTYGFNEKTNTFSTPPWGGVAANLDALRLDDGNWPFLAYYGLLYPRTLQQDQHIAKGETQ